jgi:hypothetical protein
VDGISAKRANKNTALTKERLHSLEVLKPT